MLKKTLFLALGPVLATLLTASQAQAWGAAHVGYTHVGPQGVQHYGATAASGPNGSYSGSHYSGGSAHASTYGGSSSSAYHYSGTSSYGAYHSTGVGCTSAYGGAYSSGVYRGY